MITDILDRKKLFASLFAIVFVSGLIYTARAPYRSDAEGDAPASFLQARRETLPPEKKLPPAPELKARAYLVRIKGEGEPLLAHHEAEALPPASITKLMTVFVAAELLDADDQISFSESAKNIGEKQSPALLGEQFSVQDVIKMAIIESANDAAYALAEAGGKRLGALNNEEYVPRFLERMRHEAMGLGMRESMFQNPTGLDEKNHVMSARDIARLMEQIWDTRQEIFSFSRAGEARVISHERNEYVLANTNSLLREFPGILGSKTGFTNKAGEALAFLYPMRPDKIAIVVLLGSDDRFGDGKKVIEWLEEL